jgi:hypothetical protein
MKDLKIPIKRQNIDLEALQGYGDAWRAKNFTPSLPNPLCDSTNTLDTQSMSLLCNEITLYSKLSLWINKSFLPKSVDKAKMGVEFLNKHGSDLVKENLLLEKNIIIAGEFSLFEMW